MEQLQVNIARIAIQLGNLMAHIVNFGISTTTKCVVFVQHQIERIPLTGFQWIAIVFLAFGLIYTFATPIFEAGDELEHYTVLEALKNGGLPVQSVTTPLPWHEQGSQPILYYVLGSLITKPIDTSDFLNYLQTNPHAEPYNPYGVGNKNILLRDSETVSMQGTALSVYVLRIVNVILATISLWLVYRIAQIIAPKRPSVALLAVALTAFNPMFAFVTASVSNSSLAILLNSLVIYGMLLDVRQGFNRKRDVALALVLALGVLTSFSTLSLIPVVLLVGIYIAQRDKKWSNFAILTGAIVVFVLVFNGWWFYRNWQLYNDLTGLSVMSQLAGVRVQAFSFGTLLNEFAHFRQSYWGLFGVSNIRIGDGIYLILDFLVFLSLFGVLYMLAQLYAIRDFAHARRELMGIVVLAGVVLGGMVAYFGWMVAVNEAPGRLVFPFLGAISPLLAAGFVEMVWWFLFFITPPDRSFVRAGDAVPNEALHPNAVWSARFLAFIALIVPFVTILPEYTPPVPQETIPEFVQHIYARYGDIELIAYDMSSSRYVPGEMVGVTLYWRVVKPTERDLTVSVALLPPTGDEIGKIDTYPALGKLRTSKWQTGAVYADTYFMRLNSDVLGNFPLRLQVTWWDDHKQERIAITDDNGQPLDAVVLNAGAVIAPYELNTKLASLATVDPLKREFGKVLRLEQFNFDRETSHLFLVWQNLGLMEIDYTMFAQVIDKNNHVVGQFDTQPPLPTSYWQYQDLYYSDHPILYPNGLPAGDYSLIVGVYDLVTMQRLNLDDNPDSPTNYYRLFSFSVDEQGNLTSPELDALQPEMTPEATEQPEATGEATGEPMIPLEVSPALAPTP